MKVTFLGTGTSQGVPVITCNCETCLSEDSRDKRLRSSLLVESNDTIVVIDAGPDFRQQMLRASVKQLDAILLTHEHKDHIAGMDDVRAYNFRSKKPMEVYAEERVQRAIKREYEYVFAEYSYPGIPRMKLNKPSDEGFEVGSLRFVPLRVYHHRLPILGFRVGDVAYITDANYIPAETIEKLVGIKYLIINALRREKHISHYTLDEAISVSREISPRKTFITHIGHQMGIASLVEAELPPNVILSWDGLSFEV